MTVPDRLHADELIALMKTADVQLVDVRTPAEYETAHIPGSVNVPLSLIEKHPDQVGAHMTWDAVMICRTSRRAERAQRELAKVGMTRTGVLHDGFEAWQKAGLDVEFGKPRWDLERQVRLVAGSIVAGGVALSTVIPRAKWVSAGIGGGLIFAAASNTCAMGNALAKLPYNRGAESPSVKQVTTRLK